MDSLISQETYISIKSLSKDYKITNSSTNPKKNKQSLRYQISELLKKGPHEENLEIHEKLKSWINSLLYPQLLNVFSTYNPLICSILVHMNLKIISHGDFEFALVENPEKKTIEDFDIKKFFYFRKKNHKRRDEKMMAEKEIEQALRFLDTDEYIDTLSIDGNLLKNPSSLFRLFDMISSEKAFRVPCRAYWDNGLKKWMHEYPNWHKPSLFHSLAEWACASIERGVWTKYWEMNGLDPRYAEETSPYFFQSELLPSIDSIISLPEFFSGVNKEIREDLIGDIGSLTKTFQDVKKKLSNLHSKGNVPAYSSQTGMYSYSLDTLKNYQNPKSVELVLKELSKNSEESFIEFLLCSPLDRTATIFDLTTRIIALRIKEMHTQKIADDLMMQETKKKVPEKKPRKKRKKNNKGKNKEQRLTELRSEETKEVTSELMTKVMENMYNFIADEENKKAEEEKAANTMEEEVNESDFQVVNQKKKCRRFQPQQKFRTSVKDKQIPSVKQSEVKKNSAALTSSVQKSEKNSKFLWERVDLPSASSNLNISEFPPLSIFTPIHKNQGTLHQEIVQFGNSTITKVHKKTNFLRLILEEIRFIVNNLFKGNVQLYGSYATGLAIDNSDIDLAITDVKFETREQLQQACLQLGNILETLQFVVSCKKIITATIPVVKLETDLLMYSGSSSKVMIDITFLHFAEGYHLGLEAIAFTRDFMIQFPHIQYLAIVLKTFLYLNDLNSAYQGGLNSYTLVLWITAALNSMATIPDDLGSLLLYFLDFFGNKFDPKTTGINVINRESVFSLNNSSEHAVTIDPVNYNNNTTRSSYRIAEVLKAFSQVHSRLQEAQEQGKNANLLKQVLKKLDN